MKPVGEILIELQTIEREVKERLGLFIKNNPDVSVDMSFNTQSNFIHTVCEKRELYSKEIKSELNITIG